MGDTLSAFGQPMAAEGWLDLKHGRGAVVAPRAVPAVRNEAWTEDFRNWLRGMVAEMRAQGVSAASIATELRAMAKVVRRLWGWSSLGGGSNG